jgi:HNH endonuclease/AP2 domain
VSEVVLKNGMVAIVDEEYFAAVSAWRWYAVLKHGIWYAMARPKILGKFTTIHMHQIILPLPKGMMVDHINHNGLDNRKVNLRPATRSQNLLNSRKHRSGTSRFKGVRYAKNVQAWIAFSRRQGQRQYLGTFQTEEDAARAYDRFVLEHHGEFALTNFPREQY